jgi:hypothetical protein
MSVQIRLATSSVERISPAGQAQSRHQRGWPLPVLRKAFFAAAFAADPLRAARAFGLRCQRRHKRGSRRDEIDCRISRNRCQVTPAVSSSWAKQLL